jgi:hypothetical protein
MISLTTSIMSRSLKLLIALILTAIITPYILLVTIPTQLAKRSYEGARAIGQAFREAFQFTPEVKVENTVVLNQQTPVLELSVLSQNFEHRYVWENSWVGSTKEIFISGSFNAKVGFDLRQKVSITLQDDKATVTLPQPRRLSLESRRDIEYRDENGIWNWVNLEDRTRATNAFIRHARSYAEQAAFIDDVKQEIKDKLKDLLEPYATEVIVQYSTPSIELP